MIKPLNLKQLAIESGMTASEADQVTNKGQIFAYQEGVSFADALTVTGARQGKAIRSGATLADSTQFTSQIKIDAFGYINDLPDAVYQTSVTDAVQFSTEIQLYAYKTGYVTVAEALLYTNHAQLMTLEFSRLHSISIKRIEDYTEDIVLNSEEWDVEKNRKKLEVEHSSLPFDFYTDSAILCSSSTSWGNTFDKRMDLAFKNDLATLFPSCTPCSTHESGCLQCLDSIMRDVSGCQKSQITCDASSFDHLITVTSPSMTLPNVVANEICE